MHHRQLQTRLLKLAVAFGAAATLSITGTGAATTQAAPARTTTHQAAASSADALCDHDNARMMKGYSPSLEPGALTRPQSVAAERRLDRRVAKLQRQGVLNRRGLPVAKGPTTIYIKTYVHVITRSDGTGGVTPDQIDQQIQVMNDGFGGLTAGSAARSIFQFKLAGVDYTANDDWYEWEWLNDSDDIAAKNALHQGGWTDLNLYVADFDPDGLLGYAYYPRTISLKRDGVVLLNESLPGGNAAPYNEGDAATHAVGHWLNLAHTFENGCSAPGDEVADTPAQRDGNNIFFCEESLDTCKAPGADPVHNFMSYGDDPCLDQFTKGQAERMTKSWFALRAR